MCEVLFVLKMFARERSRKVDLNLMMDTIKGELKKITVEAFESIHRQLDRMASKDVKRKGSMYSTSSRLTYSRKKEKIHQQFLPNVNPKLNRSQRSQYGKPMYTFYNARKGEFK